MPWINCQTLYRPYCTALHRGCCIKIEAHIKIATRSNIAAQRSLLGPMQHFDAFATLIMPLLHSDRCYCDTPYACCRVCRPSTACLLFASHLFPANLAQPACLHTARITTIACLRISQQPQPLAQGRVLLPMVQVLICRLLLPTAAAVHLHICCQCYKCSSASCCSSWLLLSIAVHLHICCIHLRCSRAADMHHDSHHTAQVASTSSRLILLHPPAMLKPAQGSPLPANLLQGHQAE